jgi:hypothetical protein
VNRGVTHALVTLVFAVALTGCAYIGPPESPTLDIPARITDLVAAEYGDSIRVQFTLPALTTEGLPLKDVNSVELRAGAGPDPFSTNAWAAAAQPFNVPALGTGTLGRTISINKDWIGKAIVLAIRATGPKRKTSDWSNLVILNIKTPLSEPTNLRAENVEQGVRVTWQGSSAHYRIFRAEGDQQPQQVGETDAPEYLDTTTQYGKKYQYLVQATAPDLQQSEVSKPSEVTPVDIFPPAVPEGLTAEAGVNSIELAWQRNIEPDFKGYNVFRSVEGGPFEKIAELVVAPTYSDHRVEAGKKYRYAVSAVDLTGNESQRSPVQEVTAQ